MPDVRTRPESLRTGLLLAGVGGFLDACTFAGYGGVFANAQTGNIVLFGVDAQAGHWQGALLHLPPIAAFIAIGAGVGGLCTRLIHQQAAWIAAAVLTIVLVAIVIETRRLDRRQDKPPPSGTGPDPGGNPHQAGCHRDR